jgi:hypothetical protein
MYYLDSEGKRVYTLSKVDLNGSPTLSAHPGIDWDYIWFVLLLLI